MKNLLMKYKGIILYAVFGVCTTLINWGTYYLCYSVIHIPNIPSTIIAWIIAVAFAFVTNKLWVFDSKSFDKKTLFHEIWTFLVTRLGTGFLDIGIMYLTVDVFGWNAVLWKLISNIIVIILNFILSKILIFRNTRDR